MRGVDLQLRLLEVHGATGEVIGSSDSSHGEGDEKLLSVPLKEGDYAVEVTDWTHPAVIAAAVTLIGRNGE